jgi:uncharacterized protein (DUF1499 family)
MVIQRREPLAETIGKEEATMRARSEIRAKSALALAIIIAGGVVMGCSGKTPATLGVKDGRLAPCPSSPNCVSTRSEDARHAIAPLSFSGTAAEARGRLLAVLAGSKRCRVVTANDAYIHAEFTSALFRFVDDVEFQIDPDTRLIHFRSASRLGHSDLGVNRRRMEALRAAFEQGAGTTRP